MEWFFPRGTKQKPWLGPFIQVWLLRRWRWYWQTGDDPNFHVAVGPLHVIGYRFGKAKRMVSDKKEEE